MESRSLYPLRFAPIFRRYLWGGRRLGTVLNKPIGDETCAESWEIVDHGADQSIVTNGPLAGKTLHELVHERRYELLGANQHLAQFPLLLKLIDADKMLSIQVHPDDARAAKLSPPDLGKSEAWVVLSAEPGSVIYAGLKRGFDRAALEREVHRGTCELCLHKFEPQVGDCIFLPAGVVHALGAGIVIAEIQQSSDTTYRLFDWNRTGPDGKPRTLHVEQALEAIDYQLGPVLPQTPIPANRPETERLVTCDKFILDRHRSSGPRMLGGDGKCHIIVVVEGDLLLDDEHTSAPLDRGDVVILPASLPPILSTPSQSAVMLDAYLP